MISPRRIAPFNATRNTPRIHCNVAGDSEPARSNTVNMACTVADGQLTQRDPAQTGPQIVPDVLAVDPPSAGPQRVPGLQSHIQPLPHRHHAQIRIDILPKPIPTSGVRAARDRNPPRRNRRRPPSRPGGNSTLKYQHPCPRVDRRRHRLPSLRPFTGSTHPHLLYTEPRPRMAFTSTEDAQAAEVTLRIKPPVRRAVHVRETSAALQPTVDADRTDRSVPR